MDLAYCLYVTEQCRKFCSVPLYLFLMGTTYVLIVHIHKLLFSDFFKEKETSWSISCCGKWYLKTGFTQSWTWQQLTATSFFFYEDNRQLYMYLSEHTVDVSLLWPPVPLAVTCVWSPNNLVSRHKWQLTRMLFYDSWGKLRWQLDTCSSSLD